MPSSSVGSLGQAPGAGGSGPAQGLPSSVFGQMAEGPAHGEGVRSPGQDPSIGQAHSAGVSEERSVGQEHSGEGSRQGQVAQEESAGQGSGQGEVAGGSAQPSEATHARLPPQAG